MNVPFCKIQRTKRLPNAKGRKKAEFVTTINASKGDSINQTEKAANFYRFLEFYHLGYDDIVEKYLRRPGNVVFITSDENHGSKEVKKWTIIALYLGTLNNKPLPAFRCLDFNENTGVFKVELGKASMSLYTVEDWMNSMVYPSPRPIVNGLYKLPSLSWTTVKKMGEVGAAQISLVEFKAGQVPGSYKQGFMKKINVKMHTRIHVNLMNEALTMFKCRHSQHFVQLLGVNYDSGTAIFMETCTTSLYCFLTANQGKLGQVIKLKWSKQAAEAVEHMKKQRIVHRALQTKVCFLTNDLNLKIGGFDMASVGVMDGCYAQGYRNHVVHSYEYSSTLVRWLPPETLGLNQFGFQSEVWSFGVLLWEIYSEGKKPYDGMTDYQLKKQLRSCYMHIRCDIEGTTFVLKMPRGCPNLVKSLIKACLRYCAKGRPTIEVISNQLKYYTEYKELLTNMTNMFKAMGRR